MKSPPKAIANKSIGINKYFVVVAIAIALLAFYISYLHNNYLRTNRQIVSIEKAIGPITNPLMGWAPWATIKKSEQPFTLVYADLTWREFEPLEGVYDFASFEKRHQLDRWRREGKRVVFRFVTDVPGPDKHLDIPDWLFEKIGGDGEYYDTKYGKGFSPDYSNPLFISYHENVIKALGGRYGRDGFIAFIELGSLGHWGEWHTRSDISPLPPEDIRDIYVLHYSSAFPGIHLLMRRPFTIARDLKLGLYNDMTGSFEPTTEWLDWINHGGDYLPGETNTIVPMPKGWELAPIGGEQTSVVSDEVMYGSDLETTLNLLKQSHTTFIGPGGPYDVISGGPLQDGIDTVLSTIGYRLYISRVELPDVVRFQDSVDIGIDFYNSGIAPFYYPWNVNLYLFNESDTIINTYPLPVDIRKIVPGQAYPVSFTLPVNGLASGKYTLGLAVIDPLTGAPGVRFANKNERDDLIQEIGSFQVDWLLEFLQNWR